VLENPVRIELNNTIMEPDTGDSPYYYKKLRYRLETGRQQCISLKLSYFIPRAHVQLPYAEAWLKCKPMHCVRNISLSSDVG